jgi:hypothetical protein
MTRGGTERRHHESEGSMDKKEKISNAKIDKLALKISNLLCEEGVDVKYNRDINVLREFLTKYLNEHVGLEVEVDATYRYVSWIDLRNKFKMVNPFK